MLYQEQSEKSSEKTDANADNGIILTEKMPKIDIGEYADFDDEKQYSTHLSEAGINVKNVTARWDKENSEETLENVNLLVQPGTLAAIIGPVGSGKSSLIQAILGELKVDSGSIDVNGVISYASQV